MRAIINKENFIIKLLVLINVKKKILLDNKTSNDVGENKLEFSFEKKKNYFKGV